MDREIRESRIEDRGSRIEDRRSRHPYELLSSIFDPRPSLLSAFRAVKNHPDGEVIREILESVFGSGWREDQVAGLEPAPRSPVEENAVSSRDDVNLVA